MREILSSILLVFPTLGFWAWAGQALLKLGRWQRRK
jgi:hypothetical protein